MEHPSGASICPSCADRNLAHARYCQSCGARLWIDSAEHRMVTVLYADLSGFTSYAETVDPEAVRAVAAVAAKRFGEIVVRHGGTVDKVIGDCVMATFGTPVARDDDAERAVRAALAMQEDVSIHAAEFAGLKVSIGVNSGYATYAPVGPAGGYTVLGDTVNAAARLQSAADRGQVFVGEGTVKALGSAIDLREAPPIDLGNGEHLRAWLVLGPAGASRIRRPRADLLGRDFELSRLHESWERVVTERRSHVLTLSGPAGIGKRRLIDEFASSIGLKVLGGSCLPYAAGATYWPAAEIVRSASGITHDDEAPVVAAKLDAMVGELALDEPDEYRTIAASVWHLIGTSATPGGAFGADDLSRGELHWGFRRLMELLSMREPIVIVVDGAHAAEAELHALIESFARSRAEARVLVVSPMRETSRRPHAERRRHMRLGPLGPADACAVLAQLMADPPSGERDPIIARAAGSPLYLEQAALAPDVAEDVVDLETLIDRRIEGLSPDAIDTLTGAALIGEIFWLDALSCLLGHEPSLDELLTSFMIETRPSSRIGSEREYAFVHPVVAERARMRTPASERGARHERLAAWIEQLPRGPDAYADLIAHHAAAAAGEPGASTATVRTALERLEAAAGRAGSQGAHREAAGLRARALSLAREREPAATLRTEVLLAEAGGPVDEAALSALVAQCVELEHLDLAARVELLLAGARPQRAGAHLARATAYADASGDHPSAVRAAWLAGDLQEAWRRAQGSGSADLLIECQARLGTAAFDEGKLHVAAGHFQACAELAKGHGRFRWEIVATSGLAHVLAYTGLLDDAERAAAEAIRWRERDPDPAADLADRALLARVASTRGDLAGAERLLTEGLEGLDGADEPHSAYAQAELARTLARMGRLHAAERALERARARLEPDDALAGSLCGVAEATIAAARGDGDRARRARRAAGRAAERIVAPLARGDALSAIGLVSRDAERPDPPPPALEEARAIFLRLGAHARIAEIDQAVRT